MKKSIWLGIIILVLFILSIFYYFLSRPEPLNTRSNFIPKDYIELADVAGNEEKYAGKTFSLKGNIVREQGFNIYYNLVSDEMIKNNSYPNWGVSVYGKDIEQFVRYNYEGVGEDIKYTLREDGPQEEIFVRGKLVDYGWRTDADRYIFEIKEYEASKEKVNCTNNQDCLDSGLECQKGTTPTCFNHDFRGPIENPACRCMSPGEW